MATWASAGLDMRPAWTCLIGILLAVSLNKVHRVLHRHRVLAGQEPGQGCNTGHATNIIQGIAVGYESTVAAVMIIVRRSW
jgi:K(+)-stimulated pyrophosphate-energized sodium pump